MIAYAKAYPHAVANGRPCPFPSHFLVTLDEVRTLLRHRGWNPRRATSPPREATREELKDSRVRTYQLITGTDATPRDFLGIGCRFMLGRTYCFDEQVEGTPQTNPATEGTPQTNILTVDKPASDTPASDTPASDTPASEKPLPWAKTIVDAPATDSRFICEEHACGERISAKRVQLNYRTCLACGEERARRVTYPSAPINKSAYMLITHPSQLKQLNPKNPQ